MDNSLILSFLSASILLSLLPGPDFILVLTESITRGKKYGIALSAGLASGVIIHTIFIATGVSMIVQKYEIAFLIIKVLGAVYLFYLAYLSFKEPSTSYSIKKSESIKNQFTFYKFFKRGFIANVLNPKVTLFFIAFLPQFICKTCELGISVQLLILGIIFMIQAFIVFSSVAFLADKLSSYIQSEQFWNKIKWIKIAVLIGLGIFLVL